MAYGSGEIRSVGEVSIVSDLDRIRVYINLSHLLVTCSRVTFVHLRG